MLRSIYWNPALCHLRTSSSSPFSVEPINPFLPPTCIGLIDCSDGNVSANDTWASFVLIICQTTAAYHFAPLIGLSSSFLAFEWYCPAPAP